MTTNQGDIEVKNLVIVFVFLLMSNITLADGTQDLAKAKLKFQSEVREIVDPVYDRLIPVYERHLVKLETMQKEHTKKGDLVAALALKREADIFRQQNVRMNSNNPMVGSWMMRFSNSQGRIRKYDIMYDGSVMMHDELGRHNKGQITEINGEFILTYESYPGIEKLSTTKSLQIDRWYNRNQLNSPSGQLVAISTNKASEDLKSNPFVGSWVIKHDGFGVRHYKILPNGLVYGVHDAHGSLQRLNGRVYKENDQWFLDFENEPNIERLTIQDEHKMTIEHFHESVVIDPDKEKAKSQVKLTGYGIRVLP